MKFFKRWTGSSTEPVDKLDVFNSPIDISEEMLRKDNFFHTCWMTMKQKNPGLWIEMTKIELHVSGYEIIGDKPDDNEKEDENAIPNDGKIL